MIDTLPSHTPTGFVPEDELPPSTVSEIIYSTWDKITGGVESAAHSVGEGISGGYSWLKGEVKGAADYTTSKTSSLLFMVVIAAASALFLYVVFKKEVLK